MNGKNKARAGGRGRRILLWALALAVLLAGCAPAAAAGESAATAESAASPAAVQSRLTAVLDAFVAYEADTAGGSLKTAAAAADLVFYLSGDPVPDDLYGQTRAWQQGLDAGGQALLEANWPGIYACARDICADPAAQQGLLDDAGVTGDLAALDLDGVAVRDVSLLGGLPAGSYRLVVTRRQIDGTVSARVYSFRLAGERTIDLAPIPDCTAEKLLSAALPSVKVKSLTDDAAEDLTAPAAAGSLLLFLRPGAEPTELMAPASETGERKSGYAVYSPPSARVDTSEQTA